MGVCRLARLGNDWAENSWSARSHGVEPGLDGLPQFPEGKGLGEARTFFGLQKISQRSADKIVGHQFAQSTYFILNMQCRRLYLRAEKPGCVRTKPQDDGAFAQHVRGKSPACLMPGLPENMCSLGNKPVLWTQSALSPPPGFAILPPARIESTRPKSHRPHHPRLPNRR